MRKCSWVYHQVKAWLERACGSRMAAVEPAGQQGWRSSLSSAARSCSAAMGLLVKAELSECHYLRSSFIAAERLSG